MIGHAELLAPARLAAGAGVVMAAFRAHDAQVALRQLLHARVAIALTEAGFGLAPAMAAMDRTKVLQAHGLADQRIDRHLFIVQTERVLHRRVETRHHLAQGTASQLTHQCRVSTDLNSRFGTGSDLEPHSCVPM
ncbi:hypothetical protein D9M68_758940 [compost metagenome]